MRNLPAGKLTISSITLLGRFSVNRVSFAGEGGGEEGDGGDTLGRGVDVTVAILFPGKISKFKLLDRSHQ
jgi:hypothetical protein